MFSLHQKRDHELLFEIRKDPLESTNLTTNTNKKDGENYLQSMNYSNKKQKIMHRDVERQRRQEMASLHVSLRSILPFECIKGRRSVSDHIHESVNYIKHLEKKIKELGMKREKLKKMTNSRDPRETRESSSSCISNSVKVSSCRGGVEILISSGFGDEGFALSRVLEALIEEGIDVVSYFSTQVNDRLLHTIKSEVIDPTCVDMRKLQEKLTEVINKKLG